MIGGAIMRERYVERLKDANTIVESSPTVLFRLRGDSSLPLIYISHNVTMYGYEPGAMIASPLFYQTIIHPDDAPRVMELLTQMAMKGSKPAVGRISHAREGWRLYLARLPAIRRSATPAGRLLRNRRALDGYNGKEKSRRRNQRPRHDRRAYWAREPRDLHRPAAPGLRRGQAWRASIYNSLPRSRRVQGHQ